MGIDDFDPRADEPVAGHDDARAEPTDLDEDLFDFPLPDAPHPDLPEERELAEALEAVEELAASIAPDLEEDAAPEESTAPPGSGAASAEAEGEDLFGFDEIDRSTRAVSPDLEEGLDEIFDEMVEQEFDGLGDPAIDEMLEDEDVAAAQAPPEASVPEPLSATRPAEPAREAPASDVLNEPADATAAPASAPVDAGTHAPAVPGPAPAVGASELRPAAAGDPPRRDDPVDRAKRALALAGRRLRGAPIAWLVGLLVSINLLMLVLFWSSLGDFRDAMIDTVHKVAAAAPQSTVLRERARPRLESLRPAKPIFPADIDDEEVLRAEDTLAASIDRIAKGEFEVARRDLFRLLARVDALPLERRDRIEAEANHQIGETFRGQADALGAIPDEPVAGEDAR